METGSAFFISLPNRSCGLHMQLWFDMLQQCLLLCLRSIHYNDVCEGGLLAVKKNPPRLYGVKLCVVVQSLLHFAWTVLLFGY